MNAFDKMKVSSQMDVSKKAKKDKKKEKKPKKEKKKEKVKNLGSEILYNQEVYIYIGIIAFFGIVLMFLMKGGSKAPPVPPPT